MAGITLVLVYLTEGPSIGWTSLENFAFLIPGLILTVFFFVFESKRTNPLIETGPAEDSECANSQSGRHRIRGRYVSGVLCYSLLCTATPSIRSEP